MIQSAEALKRADKIPALVAEIPWFSSVGNAEGRDVATHWAGVYLKGLGLPEAECRWAGGWEEAGVAAASLRQEHRLWRREQELRDEALARVRAAGREDQLRTLLNRLSIIGYENVRPEIDDEELARVAAGAALWTASQAIVWALGADSDEDVTNPFQPKLEIFRLGRWPVGLGKRSFQTARAEGRAEEAFVTL